MKTLVRTRALLLACFILFSTFWSLPTRSRYPDHPKPTRKAYVLSANTSSARYRQTFFVLKEFGFEVLRVEPDFHGYEKEDKAFSNKHGLLEALKLILKGPDPWGYIFEDDIHKNENSNDTLTQLIQAETRDGLFLFLGICPTENTLKQHQYTCGRCTHAIGASKVGASKLIAFSKSTKESDRLFNGNVPQAEPYLDVVIEKWCLINGGFPIFGPYEGSSRAHHTHFGTFVQDRASFSSTID